MRDHWPLDHQNRVLNLCAVLICHQVVAEVVAVASSVGVEDSHAVAGAGRVRFHDALVHLMLLMGSGKEVEIALRRAVAVAVGDEVACGISAIHGGPTKMTTIRRSESSRRKNGKRWMPRTWVGIPLSSRRSTSTSPWSSTECPWLRHRHRRVFARLSCTRCESRHRDSSMKISCIPSRTSNGFGLAK